MINFGTFLFIILLIGAIIVLARGGRSLETGFILWIWMFVIGYRTIRLDSGFALHPLVLFLVLLLLIFIYQTKYISRSELKIPRILWVFSVFWLWGFVTGTINGLQWVRMFSDALNFFLAIPLFWIIFRLSKLPHFWRSATLAFVSSGVFISLLGALEFYFPLFRSLMENLPGFIQTDTQGLLSSTGFLRANFAFFGANPAVLISAMSLPMATLIPKFYKRKSSYLIFVASVLILSIGIYISGARVAWIMTLIASIMLAYFSFRIAGVLLMAIFWVGASAFFNEQVWQLILSIYTPTITGQFLDSSLEKRFFRQQDAITLALENPAGVGWSGSGWVHGDFTQVAANLGLLAGMIFIIWYFSTLYRAWNLYRKYPGENELLPSLLTSYVLAGIVLATEGVQVLPQFVMPVWFIWGLMEAYIQKKGLEKSIYKPSTELSGLSRYQLQGLDYRRARRLRG